MRSPHVLAALGIGIFVLFFPAGLSAQGNRITAAIDNNQRITLTGHIHPKTLAAHDLGSVDAALQLQHVTVMLEPSDAQKGDLEQLLADQQNAGSAQYHRWLTPEEYAERFGASQEDIAKIQTWLTAQGLSVSGVARARNSISFSGTAAQVEKAFQVAIHSYQLNGETHFANATEPTVPAAFGGVIRSIHGLNDFRLRPRAASRIKKLDAHYNSSRGNHYLAPADFATIYNVKSLYNAGLNGTGQKIAIPGQSQIKLSDVEQFRSYFGLTANNPQTMLVPNTQDPGIVDGDEMESDLDVEWSGAIASNAAVTFVYSEDVFDSEQYIIDQNLAPVISVSYGACEAEWGRSELLSMETMAKQANAQGITWFAASGDDGAADCGSGGLAVDAPASLPEVTGVGGTAFNEGSGTYWNTSNSADHASALSYIPETSWNDSAAENQPLASGGGASIVFSKPLWQTGTGVPADNARDVPDIALSASVDHVAYLLYNEGTLSAVGGTSAPTPSFAGIAVLMNEYLLAQGVQSSSGMGNINPKLYSLAQSVAGAFHDVTSGNNDVTATCPPRTPTCTASSVGFSAGVGYDQVTGLGSVDAFNLVTAYAGKTPVVTLKSATTTVAASPNSFSSTATTTITATVTSSDGNLPTGTVTFALGSTTLGSATLTGSGGASTATITVSGASIAVGSHSITVTYSGSSSYSASSASVSVTVTEQATSGTPVITSLANGASFKQAFAPGMVLSVFGTNLATSTASASTLPLPSTLGGASATINSVAAPLYYASSDQLNIQVPYGIAAGSSALLEVNVNGNTATYSFVIAAAAPAIFTDQNGAIVPTSSGAQGQIVSLYVTGIGAVTPIIATGAAPSSGTAVANLPKPTQSVEVTVGGVTALVDFIGIPPGLAGVAQVNFTVPATAPLGSQPVVVAIGGTASPAATLTVTQ